MYEYTEDGFTTTFWMDFSIADRFGVSAIKDTYKRAFEAWHDDYRYLTDLDMVLNHKIWEHFEKKNDKYVQVYNDLWSTLDEWCWNNLEGDELRYFYRVTD